MRIVLGLIGLLLAGTAAAEPPAEALVEALAPVHGRSGISLKEPSGPRMGYFVLTKAQRDAVQALKTAGKYAEAFALAKATTSFVRTEKRTLCESSVITHLGILGHGNEPQTEWDRFKTTRVDAALKAYGAKVRRHHAKNFGGDGKVCDQTLRFMVEAARTAARTGQYLLTFGR
jgi:hypothetical protein